MNKPIQSLTEFDKYVKHLNWYLQEHYPANKKITAEEWNALFLALIKQGNLQEETLEKICNDYLPLQIEKINALVDIVNNHENSIVELRTDVDIALQDSHYAVSTSDEALKRVIENIGTAIYVDGKLTQNLYYAFDPQTQIDNLNSSIATEKDERIEAINDEATVRQNADTLLQNNINGNTSLINSINNKIPSQASNTNQLADKDFVNSSIATATATFRGTFTSLDELKLTVADENDYAYYDHTDLLGNRMFDRYKYGNNGWEYEYTLNNSSFTDEQWKAINSGITSNKLEELTDKVIDLQKLNIKYITLTVPDTAVQGTFTESQLATLQESHENKIILNNEMYRFSDELTTAGMLVYTHTGQDGVNNFYIKSIAITLSTKAWTKSNASLATKKTTIPISAGSNIANLDSYWFPVWKQTTAMARYQEITYFLSVGTAYQQTFNRGLLQFSIRKNVQDDWSDGRICIFIESGVFVPSDFKLYKNSDNMLELWVKTAQYARFCGEVLTMYGLGPNENYITDPYGTWVNQNYSAVQTPTGTDLNDRLWVEFEHIYAQKYVSLFNPSMDVTSKPSEKQESEICFKDKNLQNVAIVRLRDAADGSRVLYFDVKNTDNQWFSTDTGSLSIVFNADGSKTIMAITPGDTSNSRAIATTEWVNNFAQKKYDWVYLNQRLTTTLGSVTVDLADILPSTSGDEQYELLLKGFTKNTSGSVGNVTILKVKSDIFTDNITFVESQSQVKSVSYQYSGHMMIVAHQYLYLNSETLDKVSVDLIAYRRVK